MKVDYDSEGKSLLFEFDEPENYERVEELSTGECIVWVRGDSPVSIQLLAADKGIGPLDEAADRFGLDAVSLRAAARAAMVAPDREITIELSAKRLAGSEAQVA
jgi:hypothetical protein